MKKYIPIPLVCLLILLTGCDPHDPILTSPCIVTSGASSITSTSVTLTGKILCDGGLTISSRGFYWGTMSHPETTGSQATAGSGSGEFSADLTCLSPSTLYYIRAFAVASKGTFYGKELTFTTSAAETFTDNRDGRVYNVIRIGNQTWLAENFQYVIEGSFCYDDNDVNCLADGRLYLWDAAIAATPEGWHLPTRDEFETLISNFASPEEAYSQLATGGCSGFNAIFAGIRNHTGTPYFGRGVYADFWSTTEQSADWVYVMDLNTSDQRAFTAADRKARGFSVRYLRNESTP